MEKVPHGYKIRCKKADGTLSLTPDGDIVFTPKEKIYDDYLKDYISDIVYTDIEVALREFGSESVSRALKGEIVRTKAKVCYFEKPI